MFTIDHLGIAVKSLDAAKQFYRNLGLEIQSEETVAAEKVKTAMIPVGESRIELLEPTAPDSPIAKFIEKRGGGIHHVALHVTDIEKVVAQMKKDGVRLLADEVKIGAGGHRYIFVHPASTGGVLMELCEDQK
jgi:methylmalonyl-CoA epimerase